MRGFKKTAALFMMILILASQAGVAAAWDGSADTSWYDADQSVFVLTTAEQVAGLSKLSYEGVDFAGKTVKLGADIDLAGYNFEPIDLFKGTFDGGNHVIMNMKIEAQLVASLSKRYLGLFRKVENAVIRNLIMDHAVISPYWETQNQYGSEQAIVACETQGECLFENIRIQYCEAGTYNNTVAGVVGEAYGNITFRNVEVDASNLLYSYWGSYDTRVGGILGYTSGAIEVVFDNCVSAPVMDVYSDVCSNYQYWHYRRCGMLIGNHANPADVTVTVRDTDVYFGDWNQYEYCEFQSLGQGSYNGPEEWKFCRADQNMDGLCAPGHTHQSFESHLAPIPFTNIIGGERGDRGGQPIFEVEGAEVHDQVEYFFPEQEFTFEGDDMYTLGENGGGLQFKSSADYLPSAAAASIYQYVNQTKGELKESFEASDADPAKVKFESGSIKVTLTSQYLDTFAPGYYLLEIDPNQNNDNVRETVSGVFEIREPAPAPTPAPTPAPAPTPEPEKPDMPQTGDSTPLLLWSLLMLAAAAVAAALKKRAAAER